MNNSNANEEVMSGGLSRWMTRWQSSRPASQVPSEPHHQSNRVVLGPLYIELIQTLCRWTKPSIPLQGWSSTCIRCAWAVLRAFHVLLYAVETVNGPDQSLDLFLIVHMLQGLTLRAPCRALQLVLINISDHHTRTKANATGGASAPRVYRVMGCLLGQQSGRTVDISNSFEIRFEQGPEGIIINDAFLQKKMEQCEWGRGAG